MRPRLLIFILAVCALAAMLAYGFRMIATAGRSSNGTNLRLREASLKEKLRLATPPSTNPSCPPAPQPALVASQHTGHHRVILTWNASAFFPDPKRHAVGYCLYRSTEKGEAKKNPKCTSCERVNEKPIVVAGCIDDLVKDGANYFYVATAINVNGDLSDPSNETPAPIPSTATPLNTSPTPYPRCREFNKTQPSSSTQ